MLAWIAGALVLVAGCSGGGVAPVATEVVVVHRATLPQEPAAAEWSSVPEFTAAMLLQDMVEPRLLTPSTRAVRVRAMSDGARVAFRLEWTDEAPDDAVVPARFSDACAVQLPATTTPDVPAPQMGEPGRPVEITYWRAAWQAAVDGRKDTIQAFYPNATVDHYPFEAPPLAPGSPDQQAMALRYAPARAAGNPVSGPRERPVEDLVAEGPGTLTPAEARSNGKGARVANGWGVVVSRPLPKGLAPGGRTQVAFAVWNGGHGEVGARKMRSAWIPLLLEGAR
jgi:hypothetical protein